MGISLTLAKSHKPKPDAAKLGFGQVFTDHMFQMDYTAGKGWHDPRIEAYAPFTIDPAAMILHYGQGVFEGMKAYRTASDKIQLFRPQEHFRRLNRSNEILCIPEIDESFALEALTELIRTERDWVPSDEATALYIRPTIIAMDPHLGVRVSKTYRFFIILSPVGPYYPEGVKPTKLMVERNRVRAVPGGLGEAKTLANYAASLNSTKEAREAGYSQVIWLDGKEHKFVEEAGAMNIFFVFGNEVVTPALQGSILAGVTRDSVLHLGKEWGLKMVERAVPIEEIISAAKKGSLMEVFGTGTAAVVSPVGEIKYGEQKLAIGAGEIGPIAKRFYKALTDIQYGRAEAPKGWIYPVDK